MFSIINPSLCPCRRRAYNRANLPGPEGPFFLFYFDLVLVQSKARPSVLYSSLKNVRSVCIMSDTQIKNDSEIASSSPIFSTDGILALPVAVSQPNDTHNPASAGNWPRVSRMPSLYRAPSGVFLKYY